MLPDATTTLVPAEAEDAELRDFVLGARTKLERALVARFGVDDGLDAVADAIAYALEHWPRLREMDNPVGYLYRVGQTCGSREHERRRRVDLLVEGPVTGPATVDVDLQRALLCLRPADRVAVLLIHAHGYSYRQTAEVLGVSLTTLTNRVNRSMADLRKRLT
jgi:DNA-directed RNA polymerase specialized sigma24 family protein